MCCLFNIHVHCCENILLSKKKCLPGFRAILVSRTSPNAEKVCLRSSSEHFDRTNRKWWIEDTHMGAIIFFCVHWYHLRGQKEHTLKLIFLIISLDFSALFRTPLSVASSSIGGWAFVGSSFGCWGVGVPSFVGSSFGCWGFGVPSFRGSSFRRFCGGSFGGPCFGGPSARGFAGRSFEGPPFRTTMGFLGFSSGSPTFRGFFCVSFGGPSFRGFGGPSLGGPSFSSPSFRAGPLGATGKGIAENIMI